MPYLVVSVIMGGLFGLFFLTLTSLVFMRRRKLLVALGDAGDLTLLRRIRAQGNFVEWAPLVLILIVLTELQGFFTPYNQCFAAVCGILFLIGRTCHAYSLVCHEQYNEQNQITSNPIFRVMGMMMSIFSLMLLSLWQIASGVVFFL